MPWPRSALCGRSQFRGRRTYQTISVPGFCSSSSRAEYGLPDRGTSDDGAVLLGGVHEPARYVRSGAVGEASDIAQTGCSDRRVDAWGC
jgi:hypothetical protein